MLYTTYLFVFHCFHHASDMFQCAKAQSPRQTDVDGAAAMSRAGSISSTEAGRNSARNYYR